VHLTLLSAGACCYLFRHPSVAVRSCRAVGRRVQGARCRMQGAGCRVRVPVGNVFWPPSHFFSTWRRARAHARQVSVRSEPRLVQCTPTAARDMQARSRARQAWLCVFKRVARTRTSKRTLLDTASVPAQWWCDLCLLWLEDKTAGGTPGRTGRQDRGAHVSAAASAVAFDLRWHGTVAAVCMPHGGLGALFARAEVRPASEPWPVRQPPPGPSVDSERGALREADSDTELSPSPAGARSVLLLCPDALAASVEAGMDASYGVRQRGEVGFAPTSQCAPKTAATITSPQRTACSTSEQSESSSVSRGTCPAPPRRSMSARARCCARHAHQRRTVRTWCCSLSTLPNSTPLMSDTPRDGATDAASSPSCCHPPCRDIALIRVCLAAHALRRGTRTVVYISHLAAPPRRHSKPRTRFFFSFVGNKHEPHSLFS